MQSLLMPSLLNLLSTPPQIPASCPPLWLFSKKRRDEWGCVLTKHPEPSQELGCKWPGENPFRSVLGHRELPASRCDFPGAHVKIFSIRSHLYLHLASKAYGKSELRGPSETSPCNAPLCGWENQSLVNSPGQSVRQKHSRN